MQGTRVLPVLLALAAATGFLIHSRGGKTAPDDGPFADIRGFVERASGLRFKYGPAPVFLESDSALPARVEDYLDRRFGPSGLAHRTRALELLGALPAGQNLRGQFLAVEVVGARTWFDDLDGILYLVPGFNPAEDSDRAAMARGLCRLLFFQHHGAATPPGDDRWFAWRGVAGGLAASVEASYRRTRPELAGVPTSAETEREATLMSLPLYVHGVAQFPEFEGRDFLETPGARDAILTHPPARSDLFFRSFETTDSLLAELSSSASGARAPAAGMPSPDIPAPYLTESLGALGVRLLFERHGDFDQATALAANLESDTYTLFANGTGDHLLWMVRFTDPELAGQAHDLLRPWLNEAAPPSDERFRKISLVDSSLLLFNCSDQSSLEELMKFVP